jgi:serine/threonine protein kinase
MSGLPCGKTLDLWTLGILAYELTNFIPPFSKNQILNQEAFPKVVKIGEKYRKWPNDVSSELKDLINNLLRLNPE